VTRQYEFNFAGGYISRDHIKIQYENDATGVITQVTDLLWVNDSTIALGTAVATIPVGNTVTVYRDTPKDKPLVDYTDGAIINEANLDRSFDQAIFASAEMVDRFLAVQDVSETANSNALSALAASAAATATANTANTNASTALTQAGQAVATANTAASNAATALATANGIDAKATTALANSAAAVSTANGIDAKATTALANSNTAVTTANAASTTANAAQTTANAIDGKAQTALDNSAAAVSTANTANTTANTANSTANAANSAVTTLDSVAVKKDSNTGGANIPVGTTAQRPASPGANRPIRYNSTTQQFEGYSDAGWGSIGGGAVGGGTDKIFYPSDAEVLSPVTLDSRNWQVPGALKVSATLTVNGRLVIV
jgi:hypothetical protein